MVNRQFDVAIAGGGVIGLSIGWRLAEKGRRVVILERSNAGRGASWASAGMLGAQAEIGFEDLDVYELGSESMRLWPTFAGELEESAGTEIDYRDEGTLIVADDRDGAAHLKRVFEFQKAHDVPVDWISPLEAQEIEPMLTPRTTAAVFSRADHQVDPRQLVIALTEAFKKSGGVLLEDTEVRRIELGGANPTWKTASGDGFEAETAILASGCWSAQIAGIPGSPLPIRPVKGQMLEVRMADPYRLKTVIRGQGAYLAPKRSGRLLVGATSEEMGFDTEVTAGGLYELLERAWRLVPGIYEMGVTDMWAGLRPASPDHAPLLGFSDDPRVILAAGHYRHGILLAPVTASLVAEAIETGAFPALADPCEPSRFKRMGETVS